MDVVGAAERALAADLVASRRVDVRLRVELRFGCLYVRVHGRFPLSLGCNDEMLGLCCSTCGTT